MSPARRSRPGRGGFTLLELLAVVMILGLISSLALPYIGRQSSRTLRAQARRIAADLELARERSVVTGVAHRVQIDLDESVYWVESSAPAEAEGAPDASAALPAEAAPIGPDTPIDLSPPIDASLDFQPLPNQLGKGQSLDDDTFFDSARTPEDTIDSGVLTIQFNRDGTADPTEIVLANDGGDVLILEVLPLADTVRIHDAPA
ncbi:MAG: prepilin-type N-terminal cleavage/methylation domain-containing protein [Deltaproteobacteria bacterium]|nr:MAG: prepilin-type N-terminal cleavage/methylation domain-containing protein [Deltaproteobacteria bacterium]